MTNVAVVQPAETSLEAKAAYINTLFVRMDRAEGRKEKAEDEAISSRARAGFVLIEAREQLRASGSNMSFEAWIEANIQRSRRDCYACILIAEAEDRLGPCTAPLVTKRIWDERTKWREAKAKSRARIGAETNSVSQHQTKSVQTAAGIFGKMTHADQLQFVTRFYSEIKTLMEEIDHA